MQHSSKAPQDTPEISYTNFRREFLALAESLNHKIKSVQIPGTGIHGENLYQDYIFVDNKATTTLVHLCGLHGAEGYIGSMIQRQILKSKFSAQKTNIIFVHAVNPYGMSWFRRVNEKNVDMNRNCPFPMSDEKHREIQNAYDQFEKFHSANSFMQLVSGWIRALKIAMKIGLDNAANIIASGQYHRPNSLFYGSNEMQLEVKTLFENLKAIAPQTQKWVVIDVHTGLGPWNFDSLIIDSDKADKAHALEMEFFSVLDQKHIIELATQDKTYRPYGMLSDGFRQSFNIAKIFYLTQEIGTLPFFMVISNLILERIEFPQGAKSQKSRIQRMRRTFFPDHREWRNQSISRGQSVFHQILSRAEREA